MIKFKNVHKYFKDLHVINGVNLEVKQGEVVVVCGPSGSGKSTLIRTVNQLESIESGEIWVDGINVADPKFQSLSAIERFGKHHPFPNKSERTKPRTGRSKGDGIAGACGFSA